MTTHTNVKTSSIKTSAPPRRIMKVYVKSGSKAEKLRNPFSLRRAPRPEELAPGLPPAPEHDLRFRGGRTIAQLSYLNFFVGGAASWMQSDVDSINQALAAAMADASLNNVIRQYFSNQPISTTFLGSHFVGQKRPKLVTQTAAKDLVRKLFQGGQLAGLDFPNTVVCLMLPSGTVLTDGTGPGGAHSHEEAAHDREEAEGKHVDGKPEEEEASSLEGLGGYHGSVDVGSTRIYYAVGVYSQNLGNGKENGIAVFDVPWKNVVATFYHELNEARTDPDVDQAIETNTTDGVIGWNSDEGEECGDFPVFEAGDFGSLALVFQQVVLADGGSSPVQFQYSNAVHGPEGPISQPHALQIALEI
jgi:hypothetical protein